LTSSYKFLEDWKCSEMDSLKIFDDFRMKSSRLKIHLTQFYTNRNITFYVDATTIRGLYFHHTLTRRVFSTGFTEGYGKLDDRLFGDWRAIV
jgi:hypothetical protein